MNPTPRGSLSISFHIILTSCRLGCCSELHNSQRVSGKGPWPHSFGHLLTRTAGFSPLQTVLLTSCVIRHVSHHDRLVSPDNLPRSAMLDTLTLDLLLGFLTVSIVSMSFREVFSSPHRITNYISLCYDSLVSFKLKQLLSISFTLLIFLKKTYQLFWRISFNLDINYIYFNLFPHN